MLQVTILCTILSFIFGMVIYETIRDFKKKMEEIERIKQKIKELKQKIEEEKEKIQGVTLHPIKINIIIQEEKQYENQRNYL